MAQSRPQQTKNYKCIKLEIFKVKTQHNYFFFFLFSFDRESDEEWPILSKTKLLAFKEVLAKKNGGKSPLQIAMSELQRFYFSESTELVTFLKAVSKR